MKQFFLRAFSSCLFCILLCLSSFALSFANALPLHLAGAEELSPQSERPSLGEYACILSNNVFFYESADERKGLFLLPKSYYVRLIDYRFDFCKVEYQRTEGDAQRLVGYVKTEELTFVDYVPSRPYLYYVFDVTYTIEDGNVKDSSFLTQITLSCVYYGDYQVGSELYCYVLRGDEFGYIPKPIGLTFDKNTEYEEYLASLTPPTPDPTPTPSDTAEVPPMQIVILIVICLLVPLLAALVLKPPRRPVYEMEE